MESIEPEFIFWKNKETKCDGNLFSEQNKEKETLSSGNLFLSDYKKI